MKARLWCGHFRNFYAVTPAIELFWLSGYFSVQIAFLVWIIGIDFEKEETDG